MAGRMAHVLLYNFTETKSSCSRVVAVLRRSNSSMPCPGSIVGTGPLHTRGGRVKLCSRLTVIICGCKRAGFLSVYKIANTLVVGFLWLYTYI